MDIEVLFYHRWLLENIHFDSCCMAGFNRVLKYLWQIVTKFTNLCGSLKDQICWFDQNVLEFLNIFTRPNECQVVKGYMLPVQILFNFCLSFAKMYYTTYSNTVHLQSQWKFSALQSAKIHWFWAKVLISTAPANSDNFADLPWFKTCNVSFSR